MSHPSTPLILRLGDGKIRAISYPTEKILWESTLNTGSLAPPAFPSKKSTTEPLQTDNVGFFVSYDETLAAVNLDTGAPLWTTKIKPIDNAPRHLVCDEHLYATVQDRELSSWTVTGDHRWTIPGPETGIGSSATFTVDSSLGILCITSQSSIVCHDVPTDNYNPIKWQLSLDSSCGQVKHSPLLYKGSLYIATTDPHNTGKNYLYSINAKTGNVQGRLLLLGAPGHSPIESNGYIFQVTQNNFVECFSPTDNDYHNKEHPEKSNNSNRPTNTEFSKEWDTKTLTQRDSYVATAADALCVSGRGGLSCLSTKNGDKLWTLDENYCFISQHSTTDHNRSALFLTQRDIVKSGEFKVVTKALDIQTGKPIYSIPQNKIWQHTTKQKNDAQPPAVPSTAHSITQNN
jgi:outer membrane protein assembly factor BamB